jgi:hypothetical protein
MTKEPLHIIDTLSPTDALASLRSLVGSDDRLAARIAEMATARLRGVDPEEVAAALCDELNGLAVEQVWDRAGRTRCGCVEGLHRFERESTSEFKDWHPAHQVPLSLLLSNLYPIPVWI